MLSKEDLMVLDALRRRNGLDKPIAHYLPKDFVWDWQSGLPRLRELGLTEQTFGLINIITADGEAALTEAEVA